MDIQAASVLPQALPAGVLARPAGALFRRLLGALLIGASLVTSSGMAVATASAGRTLVVGSEQDYPPFSVGQTDDTAGGFTVDLWQAVARESGLNYTIRVRPFSQLLEEFKAGKIDVLINLAQSEQRRRFAEFTVPHTVVKAAIFVRKGESGLLGTINEGLALVRTTGSFDDLREKWFGAYDQRNTGLHDLVDLLGGLLIVVLLVVGFFFLARRRVERARSEQDLRALNASLERRVEERTAELTAQRELLEAQAADLARARDAAEAATRAKSAFLATMSHEIRTPMNGVLGMAEVLAHERLPEPHADAVRTIQTSAFSLLRIIDDILDFSKIEAGRLELERAPVALSELVESVCHGLLPLALDKGVVLDLFIDPQLPQQVWSDATRLRQVLCNLAGNAIKFSGGHPAQHGRVSIRMELLPGAAPRLALRVGDNGIGMAPQTLAQLFTAFTQAEVSTTRRFGGTGLGLAICKRLVALMDGDLAVCSTLGEGSTFSLTLPMEAVDDAPPPSSADVEGLDCIVIGTNVPAQDLAAYLAHGGARVQCAGDLDAAAQAAAGLVAPVMIHNEGPDNATPQRVQTAFAGVPQARHLVLHRGRGQRALVAAARVALDASCLRRASLLRAVAVAAGRASPETLQHGDAQTLPADEASAPSVDEVRARGQLILVAEDDEINRKVILRQIQLLGSAAVLAVDGLEALRLWRTGDYALLLTDLHMPAMDGYSLAQAIRREEAEQGLLAAERMPILALTANALREEAARAELAGMDDYLTKPVPLQVLKAALTKWLPQQRADTVAGELDELAAPAGGAGAIDVAVLEGLIGNDPAILRGFMGKFQASARRLSHDLCAAFAARNLPRLGAAAHNLKSNARAVGAQALGDLCAEFESACAAGALREVELGMRRFDAVMQAVDAQLVRWLSEARAQAESSALAGSAG